MAHKREDTTLRNGNFSGHTGEMAERIRALDWSRTPLGPIADWPACLHASVDIMLPAQAEIVLFWGEELVALYNDAYAPTIGNKHPHALGQPAARYWSELWSDLEPLLRRVMDHGETVSAKDRPFYIERSGTPETVYFDISYSPVRDVDQKVLGVLCIVSETTKRVTSERALRASEEKLRSIFSQTTSGIAQTELCGRLVLVNSRFCELVGYTSAELSGMSLPDLVHPQDRAELEQRFRNLSEQGSSFEVINRYLRKDGDPIWVTSSVSPLRDSEGKVREAVTVSVDITERKRAQEVERRLAAIIASSNDAILSTDLNMVITSWNLGAEMLYGYSADEAIGQPSTMLLLPDDRPEEGLNIIDHVRHGERVEPHETKRRHKDGRLIDVSLSVSPIFDAYGEIIGASKIARDITARKEAERLQSVLVGELNHRVKNLLATVTAIARQTFGREEAKSAASEAFHARLRSLARAHDLLTNGNWETADLREIVSEALSPYSPERFEVQGPELQLPPKAVVAMSLALHELSTNAAKYGALSNSWGKVAIEWSVEQRREPRLKLQWREIDGPPVQAPTKRGFGSRLIEGLLSMELQGTTSISYATSGLVCEVDAPINPPTDSASLS